MKKMHSLLKKYLFAAVFVFGICPYLFGQTPMEYLNLQFPKLTKAYEEELSKFPAHYIFAVDVSGTMIKFEPQVVPALRPFFQALPDGDMVTLIPFGTGTMNLPGYSGVINDAMKSNLSTNVGQMYSNPNFDKAFKAHTDIHSAMDAITTAVQNNLNYKINIIVVLTDFRNDVLNGGEKKFNKDELENMNSALSAVIQDNYYRAVALLLPVDKSAPGYCLDQLKDDVFPKNEKGLSSLEIVPVGDTPEAISHWFDQLKREIMVTKLRAIISNENRVNPVKFQTETDIDGNVIANVVWEPTKLYPVLQIDSSYIANPAWTFVNDTTCFQKTRDKEFVLNLGQLKHNNYGMHMLSDTLSLGVAIPTDYDKELAKLNIQKPLPSSSYKIDRWIWTFFLSFRTTCILVALLILYIIGIIRAIIRNNKYAFNGYFTLFDANDNQIGDKQKLNSISPSATLCFGAHGNPGKCAVQNAEWEFKIEKKKGNPFLVFAKPRFIWRGTKGSVSSGKSRSGNVGSTLKVTCGKSKAETTHKVKVQFVSKS